MAKAKSSSGTDTLLSSVEYFKIMAKIANTPMELEEAILTIIETQYGINDVKLVLECMSLCGIFAFTDDEYLEKVGQLVKEGKIYCFEFIVPNSPDKLRTMYFPKNTKVFLHKQRTKNEVNK